jgi:glutathione S-transferase
MYKLYIANKNYSSWSLRPWILMQVLKIPFTENLQRFGAGDYRRFSPSGKVPCLVDGDITVWDSLAITEYLAERHADVWPTENAARVFARSAAAEMHSGFMALRSICSMSCGVRVRLHEVTAALKQDVARLNALWNDGLSRFGGPYLAGKKFTAVDAFFAPVVFRVNTYDLNLDGAAQAYVVHMLAEPALRKWYDEALREPWREEEHEEDIQRHGRIVEDLRAQVL